MASHQLAIAKAAFAAGLLRPDPISIPREEISHFHTLLHAATTQCSSTNIQNCKRWVMRNILPSIARSASFGKYLATLSTSFIDQTNAAESTSGKRKPSARRQRLHLLYLLNDLLHHGSIINSDASTPSKLQPSLIALFKSTAEFHNCPKHLRKLSNLLELWEEKQYYAKDYIEKLRETVKQATAGDLGAEVSKPGDLAEVSSLVKLATSNTPFIMPAGHGDPSTPWYDLPAGNLMPHIVPNSTRPINPELIKPLQFVAGPADRNLADAVRVLLEDVEIIFGDDQTYEKEPDKDIDELGQFVEIGGVIGDEVGGESYYGWSRIFCEKMRQRRRGRDSSTAGDRSWGHSSDRTSSRESSRTRSDNSGGSRNREKKFSGQGQSRRRSSLSRSPTRDHSRDHNGRHSQSYSRSMTRSRSRSRSPRPERYQQADKRSRSPFQQRFRAVAPDPSSNFDAASFHPLHFIPPPGFHFDGNGLPVPPPPPPPHHQGQWPPPPPTILPSEHPFSNQSQHHIPGQLNQPWVNPQYTTRQQWQSNAIPSSQPPVWSQPPQPSQIQQTTGNERSGYGWNGAPSYGPQQPPIRGRGGYNGHRGGRGGHGGRGW